GELRAAAARLVMRLDPDAVRRRKEEAAKRDAHVRVFREDSGNAALSARELPAVDALASWQHVQQRALDLRAAGVQGSLRELRVLAMMDLLQERDSRDDIATPNQAVGSEPGKADPDPGANQDDWPGDAGDDYSDEDDGSTPDARDHDPDLKDNDPGGWDNDPDDEDPGPGDEDPGPGDEDPDPGDEDPDPGDWPTGDDGPEDYGPGPDGRRGGGPGGGRGPDGPGGPGGGRGPGGTGDPRPGRPPGGRVAEDDNGTGTGRRGRHSDQSGTSLAAQPVIVIPWEALTGGPAGPAEIPGFGMVDPQTARDLLGAACRNPQTRVCVTILGPDGTARLHGCAPGRPDPGTFTRERANGPPGTTDSTGKSTAADLIRRLKPRLAPITQDTCEHDAAEPGYTPSRRLAHLIKARNATCTAPGCGAAAAGCDLDHTLAWDKGGITCECGLAPLCRHHHKVKQSNGWRLEQPEPGVLRWRTPARLEYTTRPTNYRAG
ncbi:MAG TPA: hypothetical protein VF070_19085, partial [Streptosporangiaceae bacterium]